MMMMIVRCWTGNVRAMSRSSHRTVYEHGQAEIESVWGVKCDGTGVGRRWKGVLIVNGKKRRRMSVW